MKTGEFAYLGNRGDAATQPPVILGSSSSSSSSSGSGSFFHSSAFTASAASLDDAAAGGTVYGLSNATLNTPWPKVEVGKRRMREEMARVAAAAAASAAASHRSPELDAVRVMERVLDNVGEWREWGKDVGTSGGAGGGEGDTAGGWINDPPPPALSLSPSTFVRPGAASGRPDYGTRCSTVRAVQRGGSGIGSGGKAIGSGGAWREVSVTERVLDHATRRWHDTETRFTLD